MSKERIEPSWQFVESGSCPGSENMDCDERLARDLLEGSGHPTVRVYRWQPWAISIGRHQEINHFDLTRCAADGIDIVRRPTGGRAILHAEELTYCVVMPIGRRSILDVYNAISRALLKGLQLFGVDAELQRVQAEFREVYRHASSLPCFSSSARYEIEVNGRKLVGSAQRRYGNEQLGIVLQHGSILLGPAHVRLSEYIGWSDPHLQEEVRKSLTQRTACLQDIIGHPVEVTRLVECIRRGFELAWGIQFGLTENFAQQGVEHA